VVRNVLLYPTLWQRSCIRLLETMLLCPAVGGGEGGHFTVYTVSNHNPEIRPLSRARCDKQALSTRCGWITYLPLVYWWLQKPPAYEVTTDRTWPQRRAEGGDPNSEYSANYTKRHKLLIHKQKQTRYYIITRKDLRFCCNQSVITPPSGHVLSPWQRAKPAEAAGHSHSADSHKEPEDERRQISFDNTLHIMIFGSFVPFVSAHRDDLCVEFWREG